jgi:decaprenyl-phosphate phosphoribosyltransferase
METEPSKARAKPHRPTLSAHLQIARFDHWVKNVFVLPGVVVALGLDPQPLGIGLLWRLLLGLLATGFVASSNYVLNELLDGRFDALHPTKQDRPVPSGRVSVPLGYAQWLLMGAIGLGLGASIGLAFTLTMAWLWVMGCIYNIPPVRSKDLPYLDVLSEAINNPIRMLAGWFIVGPNAIAPASLLLSYWMVGCYFMAIKRFSEYRMIGSAERASSYRKSFAFYDEQKLLVSITFYASAAMLFLGAFIMRYRLELLLSFPFVALVMAVYLSVSFKHDSAAQAPEKLYREPYLMGSVIVCAVVMSVLVFVDFPQLSRLLAPTAPTNHAEPRSGG